jgi:uncharacterized protein (DUF2132 family)
MDNEINYKSNPLHGVSLKTMLTELVDHYGFEILYAYLYNNCFRTNPGIASSVKFLSNTDWARENLENFYLYQFRNLPSASAEQFLLPPRDRVIPEGQAPGKPAELSLEDAEQLRAKRAKKADGFRSGPGRSTAARRSGNSPKRQSSHEAENRNKPVKTLGSSVWGDIDPWAKAKK